MSEDEPLFYRHRPVLWGLSMLTLVRINLVLLLVAACGYAYLIVDLDRVKVSQHDLQAVVCQLTQAVVRAFPEEVKDPKLQQLVTQYDCPPLPIPSN